MWTVVIIVELLLINGFLLYNSFVFIANLTPSEYTRFDMAESPEAYEGVSDDSAVLPPGRLWHYPAGLWSVRLDDGAAYSGRPAGEPVDHTP
jgi:hypothetical protein